MKKIIASSKTIQPITLDNTNLSQGWIRSWENNNTEFIKKIAKKLPSNAKVLDIGSGDFRNSVNLIKNGMKYNKGEFKCYGIDNGIQYQSTIFTEKDGSKLMEYFEWLSCINPKIAPLKELPTIIESSVEKELDVGIPNNLDATLLCNILHLIPKRIQNQLFKSLTVALNPNALLVITGFSIEDQQSIRELKQKNFSDDEINHRLLSKTRIETICKTYGFTIVEEIQQFKTKRYDFTSAISQKYILRR